MKIVEISKFEKRKATWRGTQPYTMAFCYPKKGPVLVKGMAEDVEKYVRKILGPCHYRVVYFGPLRSKKGSGMWQFNVSGCFLSKRKHPVTEHERWELLMYKKDGALDDSKVFKHVWLRKVPMRYMKELDEFNKE